MQTKTPAVAVQQALRDRGWGGTAKILCRLAFDMQWRGHNVDTGAATGPFTFWHLCKSDAELELFHVVLKWIGNVPQARTPSSTECWRAVVACRANQLATFNATDQLRGQVAIAAFDAIRQDKNVFGAILPFFTRRTHRTVNRVRLRRFGDYLQVFWGGRYAREEFEASVCWHVQVRARPGDRLWPIANDRARRVVHREPPPVPLRTVSAALKHVSKNRYAYVIGEAARFWRAQTELAADGSRALELMASEAVVHVDAATVEKFTRSPTILQTLATVGRRTQPTVNEFQTALEWIEGEIVIEPAAAWDKGATNGDLLRHLSTWWTARDARRQRLSRKHALYKNVKTRLKQKYGMSGGRYYKFRFRT